MSLKNEFISTGIYPRTVQLVAQRFKYYATPGPALKGAEKIILSYLYTVFCNVEYIFLESDASSIRNRFEFSCTYQYIRTPIKGIHIRVCIDNAV
jgi:hypothetical protein